MCNTNSSLERERLRALRESMSNRRRTLAMAHALPPIPPSSPTSIPSLNASLSVALSRARSGLVQELVEVFNVVEVGGRPPIGGKAGTKGEWTIGDLVLPVPGDIRRKLWLCGFLLLDVDTLIYRISTRPYQCCNHPHHPLPWFTGLLSWYQAPIRDYLVWE